jgi:DNA polymerase-4
VVSVQGIDGRAVECVNESLSVSNEHTFETDTGDMEVIKATLMALSDSVSSRLRKEKLSGKTITLKIRLEGFHTYTRQMKIDPPKLCGQIYGYILRLFEGFGLKGQKVRLLGVKVSGLSTGKFFEYPV